MLTFNYENNLAHQKRAVDSILSVFNSAGLKENSNPILAKCANREIVLDASEFRRNLRGIQRGNGIDHARYFKEKSQIIDISMETGTGKTYTYTKMMFELNKELLQCKFIIIVPTLSIKAGTINFLNSKATREHFRHEYGREINLYIVESKKPQKSKKEQFPLAIHDFVEKIIEPSREIEVLIINQGMLNSDTLDKSYQKLLFDSFDKPFEALKGIAPLVIIDEPHRFKQENKTFENIKKIGAPWIFRFGATFDNTEENLVYKLTSVQAFNDNLVKGVNVCINAFSDDFKEKAEVKLVSFDSSEAKFTLFDNGIKKSFVIGKKEMMSKIHKDFEGLFIENIGRNFVLLSNGLELVKNSTINPYSYNTTLNQEMISRAIDEHLKLEKELLAREDKIKPLTLFFIDDIDGYRSSEGRLRRDFESMLEGKIKSILEQEERENPSHKFYIEYLKKSLQDISLTHGGYFSKDNSENDEKIQNEIKEILHDKESLLSLENPRRFIFSKWTLREGWDNPNVFGICKLRSSGSTTSKLQEVGRGLRLPVNEYGSRIKGENFYLNYFVDFSEKAFADLLIHEVNAQSGIEIFSESDEKISSELIKIISELYDKSEDDLIDELAEQGIIKASRKFQENGFKKLKERYPLAFAPRGVRRGRIVDSRDKRPIAHIRAGKYNELKALWERINQKVILQYKIKNESEFFELFAKFLKENREYFKATSLIAKEHKLKINESTAYYESTELLKERILPISYMKYGEFLLQLSTELRVRIDTIHSAFYQAFHEEEGLKIDQFLSYQTIRFIKSSFSKYLLDNSIHQFSIEYKRVKSSLHIQKTAFTDTMGRPLQEIEAGNLGVERDEGRAVESYLFDEIFYDSELERENILENIDSITVFTKIPKNSIKIPLSGGGSYSPDFAYILRDKKSNQTLHLVIEVKNKEERDLLSDEKQKIAHAKKFFEVLDESVRIDFKTQLKSQKMREIINALLKD